MEAATKPRREERPPFANHVVAVYDFPRTFNEDGLPNPQEIDLKCEKCGATWKTMCTSGAVRSHIMNFAVVHVHKDAFNEEKTDG